MAVWLSRQELLDQVGISAVELGWLEDQFGEQMRFLTRQEAGAQQYARDAVALLRGLSAMIAQGATPAQIKGWFGLAAARQPAESDS